MLPGHHGAGEKSVMLISAMKKQKAVTVESNTCLERVLSATGIVRLAKKALASSNEESVLRNKEGWTRRSACA